MSELPEEVQPNEEGSDESLPSTLQSSGIGKGEMRGIFEQVQMRMMRGGSGVDLGQLSPENKTQLLEIIAQEDKFAYEIQSKKIDSSTQVKLAEIRSKTVGRRTLRYIYIGLLALVLVITLIMLFYNDKYISQWFALISGSLGGFGIGRMSKDSNRSESPNPPEEPAE